MIKLNKKILIILVMLASILLFWNTFTYAVDLNSIDEDNSSNTSTDTNVVSEEQSATSKTRLRERRNSFFFAPFIFFTNQFEHIFKQTKLTTLRENREENSGCHT